MARVFAQPVWRRALSTPVGAPAVPARVPRLAVPLERAAFAAPFELVCCGVLSAARAGPGAERDDASHTLAEAACRRATYVTDRWFVAFSDGAAVVTPDQFDAGVRALLDGGAARAALGFRALDADGDGVIGEDELRKYLRSFNTLYFDGYDALHLDKEAAANLAAFCERWTDGLARGMLDEPASGGARGAPLTLEAWRARPHAGQLIFIDAFVEHAGHCFGHMASKTDRVIDEIRGKRRARDGLRLVLGTLGMGAVVSLFFL
ncbi:hypothetical protein KFE25_007541 [Diacronema lutheri]|uniref:EF-hand domain-containing protein n=1 Tax=Diacronema lutheri TaxID=2081491 RepID=A0A8J5XJL2_DIALT|nr:hypothetical protein KFE25_007541 [Diacronema lutheri]